MPKMQIFTEINHWVPLGTFRGFVTLIAVIIRLSRISLVTEVIDRYSEIRYHVRTDNSYDRKKKVRKSKPLFVLLFGAEHLYGLSRNVVMI